MVALQLAIPAQAHEPARPGRSDASARHPECRADVLVVGLGLGCEECHELALALWQDCDCLLKDEAVLVGQHASVWAVVVGGLAELRVVGELLAHMGWSR